MSLLSNDTITQLSFSIYENRGVFALLLGSGLSRAAEIPTGWEITLDLVRRIGEARGAEAQSDWAQWYREETGEEPNYSTLLEELASSPEERRSILHSYIEPTEQDREEGRKIPTAAHRAIAQLVRAGHLRVIVTTNFDRLMENALREVGVEPTIVASVDALQGAEPITHSTCYILKLHGDYKDARILNTDEELRAYPTQYDTLLDRIFDEFGVVICGWSGEWDHALRAAMLRAPNRRYSLFWASRGRVGSGAQELIDHRRARVIEIGDADAFFTAVAQRVETLEKSHRQNPRSIELLVGTTKRYLAKPEYRIQLDELFADECKRLIEVLDAGDFSPHGSITSADIGARVQRYEAATEALALMAGTLGRWGDGTELPLVLDLLQTTRSHAGQVGNGLTAWIELRSYPAVLIFTSYGIGLTRASRWSELHRLLTVSLPMPYRDSEPAVKVLFLSAWSGGENNFWQKLEGLDRRKTALSDHLHDVFEIWSKSFVGMVPDFELLFERFEVLASIASLDTMETASLKEALADVSRRDFIWMPVGRSAWHTGTRERLFKELEAEPMKQALLEAGFARGSSEHYTSALTNYSRMASRISW
ncbi:hypothetical protein D0Z70_13895 [Sphingobium terrigena]|uniref:Uncharacterized protein n=1 Tax=Sphingobium terrigena TaxID=2304063 RepID=A0A418YRH0_9SPHN|nr:SIR2 family protein [Sphingobium terrigena]RJG54219.1 hypothetical protein D0Z70_13895 [Sphingobium terrigena]